jgi:hypothetical protein
MVYNRGMLVSFLFEMQEYLRKGADLTLLRGLLALEQGDTVTAERLFRRALDVYTMARDSSGGELLARYYVQQLSRR